MNNYAEKLANCYLIFCIYSVMGWLFEVSLFLITKHKFVNRGYLFGPYLPIYGSGVLILLFAFNRFKKKKHKISDLKYLIPSTITVVTFIYVTIIEYTKPKILRVDTFLQRYGIIILLINIIAVITSCIIVSKTENRKLKELDATIILIFLATWIMSATLEYTTYYLVKVLANKTLWTYKNAFLNIKGRICWDASKGFSLGGIIVLYLIQPIVQKILTKANKPTKISLAILIGIMMFTDYAIKIIK